MTIGYARVSATHQSLDRQIDMLTENGCEKIYTEKASTRYERPELNRLINEILRKDDILVVTELSRVGRSLNDTLGILEKMNEKQVSLKSLTETWLDTSSDNPMSKMIIALIAAFNQLERDLKRENTKAGLKSARARGTVGGRPPVDMKNVKKAIELYKQGNIKVKDIARLCEISASTIYRYLEKIGKEKTGE